MRNKKHCDSAPNPIGFRLDLEYRKVLATRARALGVSSHELARRYLIQVLEESEERAALGQAVHTVNANLTTFREEFIFAIEALLVSAGKVKKEDARPWIDEHFN